MPAARANSADPPNTTSRVWLRYTRALANGAAPQGLTISAEIPPTANTPATRAASRDCDASVTRLVKATGSCSSQAPNIDMPTTTSPTANAPSAHGLC